jgi:MFS family permease
MKAKKKIFSNKIKFKNFNFIAAIIVAGAGFLYGYDISLIKVVFMMDAFRIWFRLATWDGNYRNDNGTLITVLNNGARPKYRYLVETENNNFVEGVITTGYVFGTIFGALIVSYMGDKMGRRKTIIFSSIIFSVGAFVQACSFHSAIFLSVGRFILGLSIGGFTVICPVYISELIPAKSRGEISYIYYMFMIGGIVFSAILNAIILYLMNIDNTKELNVTRNNASESINNLEWRLAFFIQAFLGSIYSAVVYVIPKSPRWLCFKERNVEAIHTLANIYNANINDAELQEEFDTLKNDAIVNRAVGHQNYSELLIPSIRQRTFNIIFMNCIQQWTGIAFFLCFHTQIFRNMDGSEIERVFVFPILTFFIAAFLTSFVCFSLIDRYGRKSLLLVGTLIMLVISFYNIFAFPFQPQEKLPSNSTPLYSKIKNCKVKSGTSFHHDNDLGIDLFNDECHEFVYFCPQSADRISWDKDISKSTYKDITKKFDEFCKIANDASSRSVSKDISKISIHFFICIYISTWLPVPFIYKAEIFPLRIRMKGSAVGTITNRINYLIIMAIYPYLYRSWGSKIVFLFTFACVIGSIFTIISCTECKGVSLEKMEEKMSGKVVES